MAEGKISPVMVVKSRIMSNPKMLHLISRIKYVFIAEIFFIVAVVVSLGIMYKRDVNDYRKNFENFEKTASNIEKKVLSFNMSLAVEKIKLLAENDNIKDYLTLASEENKQKVVKSLIDFNNVFYAFNRVQVITFDDGGKIEINIEKLDTGSALTIAPKNIMPTEFIKAAANASKRAVLISGYKNKIKTAENGQKIERVISVIGIAVPLFDKYNNKKAVLMLYWNTDNLLKQLAFINAGEFNNLAIINPNETLLAYGNLKSSNNLNAEKIEDIISSDTLKNIIANKEGQIYDLNNNLITYTSLMPEESGISVTEDDKWLFKLAAILDKTAFDKKAKEIFTQLFTIGLYLIVGGFFPIALFAIWRGEVVDKYFRNEYEATFDKLSGLYNRSAFVKRLTEAVDMNNRYNVPFSLVYMDLDGFKDVNDKYGHEAGDSVITGVGLRLKNLFRKTDIIGRVGGDEFIAIALGQNTRETSDLIAKRIIDSISRPFKIRGKDVNIGVSVGIAFCPQDAREVEHIIKAADHAMYEAKESGKNTYRFFSDTI